MTQAGDCEVFADVSVRCGLCEKIRVEEHVVSERRLILRVQLDHHVRQVTMFAWHYYLRYTCKSRLLLYVVISYLFLQVPLVLL